MICWNAGQVDLAGSKARELLYGNEPSTNMLFKYLEPSISGQIFVCIFWLSFVLPSGVFFVSKEKYVVFLIN